MKPRFRIIPNPSTTPTQMKITRATSRAGLDTGEQIFSGAYASTYTDAAVTVAGCYWYRVELSDNGTDFVPIPIFSCTYITDYGPCLETLSSTFVSQRRPIARGTGRLGALLGSLRIAGPTQTAVTNWPALVSSGAAVAGSPVPVATAAGFEPVVIDGIIHYIPVDLESLFRIGGTAITSTDAAQAIANLKAYLDDPLTTANVYTVAGFKYRLVILSGAQVELIGNSWLVTPPTSTPVHYSASTVSRTSTYFLRSSDSAVVNIDNTGTAMAYNAAPASIPTLYVPAALKYVGPA